jgi:hypothetical protein
VGLLKSKGRVETAKDRVRPLAESASQMVGPVAGQVRDHLGPAVGSAREKVSPYAEKAVERGAIAAHHAVEKAGPVIDDVLGKVGPAAELAAEKARERFNDDVLPKVTAALAALAAAAEPAMEETSRRGRATKAALKGEIDVPKKSSHKLRKVVLFLGFGAIVAAVAKKLLTPPEPAWQSTPTSGREYSSSPAGSATSRYATDRPGAADKGSTAQSDVSATAEDKAAGNGAIDANAEAQATEDTATKSAANGAAKKPTSTSPRRSTGSNNSKPADDA